MNTEETVRNIKAEFRRGMNGVVSTSMREKGLSYKLNFGLTLPILKSIAQRYPKDAVVAEKLWSEEIRESKLLATMLYPSEEMSTETAKRWISEIPNTEVADICCMYLISRLPDAKKIAYGLSGSEKEMDNYMALSLFNRLAMNGEIEDEEKTEIEDLAKHFSSGKSQTLAVAAIRLTERLQQHDI